MYNQLTLTEPVVREKCDIWKSFQGLVFFFQRRCEGCTCCHTTDLNVSNSLANNNKNLQLLSLHTAHVKGLSKGSIATTIQWLNLYQWFQRLPLYIRVSISWNWTQKYKTKFQRKKTLMFDRLFLTFTVIFLVTLKWLKNVSLSKCYFL